MIELTIRELSQVAGGDAGFSAVFDDAGPSSGTFAIVSQPTASSVTLSVDGTGDVNGEFEATFALFSNTGLPEE